MHVNLTPDLVRMQGQADRVNYLMTKQAKIVAMTCTHAALKRREFMDLGFKFDNLLMEESAQILEIETFIPMLLQVHSLISSSIKTSFLFTLELTFSEAWPACTCLMTKVRKGGVCTVMLKLY